MVEITFVEVELTTSEAALQAEAITKFKELLEARGVTGWEENPADLSVIQIGTDASLAAVVALIVAVVPPAVFRKFGTEILRVPYKEGAAATVTTTWKLLEEGGEFAAHTIEAGTQLTIAGAAGSEPLVFLVKTTTTIAKGESSKSIELVAAERGTESNGLTGTVELVNALSFVEKVTIVGETSGGVNQESDEEYQNRLNELNKTLSFLAVTASQFALKALNTPESWNNSKGEVETLPAGTVIGRSTAIDGYNGTEEHEPEGKVTASSKKMTEVTSYTGITNHTEIVGAGIPKGTTVAKKPTAGEEAAKELEMTNEATKTEAKQKYKFIGTYENERYVTVWVTNKQGKKLTAEQMEAIEDYLESIRELNFKVEVREPKYTEVQVKTKIHVLPEFVAATVESEVKKKIESFLSPEIFAKPNPSSQSNTTWLNIIQGFATVRYNQLLGEIEKVSGVQYVFAGSEGLSIGLEEAPGTKTADLTLPGPAPLPETKAANITVTSA